MNEWIKFELFPIWITLSRLTLFNRLRTDVFTEKHANSTNSTNKLENICRYLPLKMRPPFSSLARPSSKNYICIAVSGSGRWHSSRRSGVRDKMLNKHTRLLLLLFHSKHSRTNDRRLSTTTPTRVVGGKQLLLTVEICGNFKILVEFHFHFQQNLQIQVTLLLNKWSINSN